MMIQEIIGKILAGERDGTTLWKIAISEIGYEPISDPAEGVLVAALAENILRCGQLQPILVHRSKESGKGGLQYKLISGRRRVEAVRMLGHTHVSAIVVRCDADQAAIIALSENLLHREPNTFKLASQLKDRIDHGADVERLASLLAMPRSELERLTSLTMLPEDEIQLLKLANIARRDIFRLAEVAPSVRKAVLARHANSPEVGVDELIDQWKREHDLHSTQSKKIWVGDIRVFLNSVERAIQTMRNAGFDAKIKRVDDIESYTFTIQVAKRPGALLKDDARSNVSRETLAKVSKRPRFSSALSIFEAIAEDECSLSEDVSRETFMEGLTISEENAEKLELCID